MFFVDQGHFAAALLDPARAVPNMLTTREPHDLPRRFAVYRNNVVTGLIEALRARFPASEKITGEEFFAALAKMFVVQSPPQSPVLWMYGDTFADFVATFPPANDLPYLPDVIRIEAARTHAYHAADKTPLSAEIFAAIASEDLPRATFRLIPGTFVLRSTHPACTIWAMNADEIPLAPISDWRAEDILIARDGFDVAVRRLAPGQAAFLQALMNGDVLAQAAAIAQIEDETFDLSSAFALLIEAGLVAAIEITPADITQIDITPEEPSS
jgi:hypothetical protein